MKFPITHPAVFKEHPADETKLGFGKIFTDHMFMMDYSTDKVGTI